jgi:DNA polymerase III epsilon subunit-like protein
MKSRLLCVDVETGGLDAGRHGLLSVACVDSRDGEAFTALIRPAAGLVVEPEALAVNGLSLELLEKAGRDELDVMSELCLWLGARRDAVLAGCNVGFDRDFLVAGFGRHGVPWPMSHRMLDVRGVAWLAWEAGGVDLAMGRTGQPRLDLDSIAKGCGFARTKKTHDALEDALMTLACFERLTRCVEMTAKNEPEVIEK